jgi:predicted homoserine dehydrogenase-like protein
MTGHPAAEALRRLARPVRVGVIGAGAMGKGVVYQCAITPGVECVALADIDVGKGLACCDVADRSPILAPSPSALQDAAGSGQLGVCEDGSWVSQCDAVDVVVECSSAIVEAAQFVLAALERGKTVVLVNAEVDLAFGPLFSSIARSRGVVCTSADGDQHGVIKRLVDDLTLWGFDLAMAGNIKGFLNREADPENTRPEADKRKLDYRMCTAYTDGPKLSVEMALLANALGLRADVPGMHGPRADHVYQALELFDLDALRSGGAVVDYVLGAQPDGGVFAIGHCEHPYQRDMMAYYKMGPGPYYVFYRPYHLCHIELMAGLVAAHLDGEALLEPAAGFRTDVYAWAKRDLKAGEVLDGVGGFTCYGMIENCDGPWLKGHLPICLSEGLRVKRDIPKDAPIALRDVAYDPSIPAFALHARARECTGG